MRYLSAAAQLTTLVCLVLMSACGKSSSEQKVPHEDEVQAKVPLTFDSALSYDDKARFVNDVYSAMQYDIEAPAGSPFEQVFGGDHSDDVMGYLRDRVHYILDPSRLSNQSSLTSPQQGGGGSSTGGTTFYAVAVNIGIQEWFEATSQHDTYTFFLNDQPIQINDPRVGLVALANGYVGKDSNGNDILPSVARFAAIVHEGRHSDCTGGITSADLSANISGQQPQDPSCGHVHAVCPSGTYQGLLACDNEQWGSYAVQAVYSAAVQSNCQNCSDDVIKDAQISALDSLSRILPLNDGSTTTVATSPDMSSTATVR